LEIEAQSYGKAITALRGAFALAPGDLRVRNLLASAYLSKGETESAQAQLNKVLAKDPENRLLSRGARFRMDAEMLRDYALAASGLLQMLSIELREAFVSPPRDRDSHRRPATTPTARSNTAMALDPIPADRQVPARFFR